MTNHSHGIMAENTAAEYLTSNGFLIKDRNWKTKWCEIDIVALKEKSIYFVEVKYRINSDHGNGLDYVTPRKLNQMSRSVEGWVQVHNWNGNYQLAVIEVRGEEFRVSDFILEI